MAIFKPSNNKTQHDRIISKNIGHKQMQPVVELELVHSFSKYFYCCLEHAFMYQLIGTDLNTLFTESEYVFVFEVSK